jgi:Ca-activated chloride channel homolog
MKLKSLFIVFGVLPFLLLTGCSEKTPSTPSAKSRQTSSSSQDQASTSVKPHTTAWPYISKDKTLSEMAKNPTGRNFLLIFDGSGSMQKGDCADGNRKIDVAKQAVKSWSQSVPPDANLGLLAFHDNGFLTLPLASNNREIFIRTVDQIITGGSTPLAEAMEYAYKIFTKQGRSQLGYGEYTIVVVTDGIADSIYSLKNIVDKILSQSPINIYSIGFCIDDNHSLNQPGRTIYRSAGNPDELRKGLQEVLAESESFDEKEFLQ